MIPYDDLVASLTSWRERQGLPVHRESLFDVDPSAGLVGVAEALATPLVPEPAHGADDTGETRLATADVVSAEEEHPGLSDFGEDGGESTYIGTSPGWGGADEAPGDAPPAESPWESAAADATGESPVAPPGPGDVEDDADGDQDHALGDAIDAALVEGDLTPDVPPPDPADAAEAETGSEADHEETFIADATAVRSSSTESDALPAEAAAPGLDVDAAADTPAPGAAGEPANPWTQDRELAADDGASAGGADAGEAPPFQDAATAIRDPSDAGPSPFEPAPGEPSEAELDVDLGDVLESEADPDAGEDSGGDDPFRP